jgi:hypothetical protein
VLALRNCEMRILILIIVLLLLPSAFGHEDPRGDVHPRIEVENGAFVVWFRNNTHKATTDMDFGGKPPRQRFPSMELPSLNQ